MQHAAIDPDAYLKRIASADPTELAAIEQELFGRKTGVVTLAMKGLAALDADEKREQGKAYNLLKKRLDAALLERRSVLAQTGFSSLATDDPLDITLERPREEEGHLHPITEFIREVEDVFSRMGFAIAYGREIESEEMNFYSLNFEKDHPALDMQATFFLKDRPGHVLRTHTSPTQIRFMHDNEPPFRMICPGKVYRKDADATHSPMFHQFEGLMVDRDVSIANMKAVMTAAMKALLGDDIDFRFRTSYFPFVEPGLEVDIRWAHGGGDGRWLEVVGCGMVHPTVLKNGGIDPEEWQGFAFGFGVERLLMIKHRIPDLRLFYEGDLRFLRQF